MFESHVLSIKGINMRIIWVLNGLRVYK